MTTSPTLRDRIAEALISWTYRGKEPDPEVGILETVRANAYSRADAVLAVLPATTNHDTEIKRLRRELAASERIRENADFHLGQEMARRQRAEKETAELRRVADETCRVLHEVLSQFRQTDNNGVVPDGEVLAFVGPTVTPETYWRWCDSAGARQDGA